MPDIERESSVERPAPRDSERRMFDAAYDFQPRTLDFNWDRESRQEHREDRQFDRAARSGHTERVAKGEDSYEVLMDDAGRITQIRENFHGRVNILSAGKDFQLGDATLGADKSVTIKSPDGKMTHTLKPDLSCSTKILGEKGDGSDDKLVRVRTIDGVQREFYYDEKTNQVAKIVDRLQTNSGKELIEESTRLGNSNVWDFQTNYGRKGRYTNLVINRDTGSFSAQEIKRSIPSDLADKDNSDAFHKDVAAARQHLAALAADCGVFGGKKEITDAWCRKFEQRCRDLAHDGRRAPTDKQIMRTYEYLEKILNGKGNGVGSTSRKWLVESALREYANPNRYINQGSHPSCCLAATERHVVETMPEDHARVLYEAVTFKSVLSKNRDGNGKYRRLNLYDHQIKPDNEAASIARGNGWNAAWSYSNKIFQIAAIKLAYPGYQGNGHGFPGASIDQARTVNKFITGEQKLPLVNRWYGGKPSFSSLQGALKNGTVHYFVPGHAMAIDKAIVHKGVAYVHVDNWHGGSGDGWRRWENI